jgi:predicted choloylglycine hydrolase
MVHCRNLDWPIWQMKRASVILDCQSEAGSFKAVSVPGMVGVLSGVAEGRFSITINSNDHGDHLVPCTSGWSAALLVRWIFENCSSYEEALRELKKTPAFVPFYAMVVGPGKGQAAVVEVNTDGEGRVYKQQDYPVAVANHFPSEIYEDDEDCNTQERQDLIETAANRCKAKTLAGCFSVVNEVLYSNTVQSMVLHPRSGAVLLQQL